MYAADQQRKEAAERQKKGRERAKLLKTGEERKKRERQEKGTNFMIFLDMMQFNVFNPVLFFCYNYFIASLLVISLLHAADQQRKKAAERQKKGRERAKLLKTGEERGIGKILALQNV